MEVYGSDAEEKKDSTKLLGKRIFLLDDAVTGELETNKEGETMTLAAYGLARLMQDRCSSFSDKFYGEDGFSEEETAIDRIEEYQKVYDLVSSGRFNVERESAGKKNSISASIVRAFKNYCATNDKHLTDAQCIIILSKLEPEKLVAIKELLKTESFIKDALEELKNERLVATDAVDELDLGDLLDL